MFKYAILLIFVFSFIGCNINIGGGKDPYFPPTVTNVEFTFSPNDTVSVGDSLTITCTALDALHYDLQYTWNVGIYASKSSGENSITFIVSEGEGRQNGRIIIGTMSPPLGEDVTKNFSFYIANEP